MAAAALFGKRSTRFRHVYGLPAQKENCYDNIRVSGNAHDSMFCAVNRSYLAVVLECAGGGGFTVLPLQRTVRIDHNAPKVCGHSAPVMDIKWNPFNDNIIASASDDATVKLWEIPRAGLRSDMTRYSLDLRGHSRRVAYVEWHPTAENILLSAGFDHQTILWNLEMGSPVLVSQCHPDVILSLSWNRDGSLYATTCKDRTARVVDPRSGKPVLYWEPHQGSKTTKIAFLGDTKQLFTTGFSQFAQRQYGLWDMRALNQGAIKQDNVDSASGALFPFYDHDTRMVYLAGKGDGNIRYFELTPSEPFVYYLSEYQSPYPQRGLGVMPKLGLDSTKCEIFRFYKLHSNRPYCEPISMIAPRKAETFQEDLYPPTAADRPALSAIEWIGGTNRDPILVNIRDPKLAVNCPPMVTSRPVQPNRMPNQAMVPPPVLSYKAPFPSFNGNVHPGEIDENSLPQSVRNIRKLVSGVHEPPPLPLDFFPAKLENGNSNETNPAALVPVINRRSSSSQISGELTTPTERPKNGLENGHRLGHSEQSIPSSSRGSDSVFERAVRKSEMDKTPSPNAEKAVKQLLQQVPEHMAGSKQSLSPGSAPEAAKPQAEGIEVVTISKPPADLKSSKEQIMDGSQHHHHHNIQQIRHDEPQTVAMANVVPSDSLGGAFKLVTPSQHHPPPLSLAIPGEKPISSGFVVQTAVASPKSPSQRAIQKLPPGNGFDTQLSPATADRNSASDVPLASPQFRRGATGSNVYQAQPQNYQQQPQPGVTRSPSGRATRPDILDVLQEQLSASSRELRGTVSPTAMHQPAAYSSGPAQQASHLSLAPTGSAGNNSNGRNSRNNNNMSPAERRFRNRTIAAPQEQHAFVPIGDFTPGLNFASPQQRPMPPPGQQIYYQQMTPQQSQSHAHRRVPPPPNLSHPVIKAAPVGATIQGTPSSRMPNIAVVDVRDDMAPSIMRPSQQRASPSGLNRSQTMYLPVADNNGFATNKKGGGCFDFGPKMLTMPLSPTKNGAFRGGPELSPGYRQEDRGRPKDRAHRPRRDLSAAAAVVRAPEQPQPSQYYQQPQQQQPQSQQPHQTRAHQKAGEDSYEAMTENDLRSYCRRQRDEIRLLRRQCEAKDQVISRLESELRHLAHQLQQRHGIIGGAGAQAITAVGP